MARKRNVDAFGKSWSPIDIQNLEKAVKLYERLNTLNKNFADSLSGANNIWKQINEKAEIQEELQRLGVKHSESECKYIIQLSKEQNKFNQGLEREKNIKNIISKQDLATSAMQGTGSGFSLSNAGSFYQSARLQGDAARILKQAAQSAGGHHLKKGTEAFTSYVNDYATKKMGEAAGKYSTSASIIQVAANTFSKAVNVFSNLFMQGMRNQYNSYNNNFSNISVRTGMTRSTYFSQQLRINSNLSSQGLYNNVRNSEVTDMWNKLANTGMNQADMIANALDNVITNKIVPYLDTSSQQFNILNSRLDGNFVKQIRGINLYNQEIAGNNYNTEKLLQQIIDEVQPMSDEALQNLTKGSAEMTAIINKLTPIMGADAATQYATQLFKSQKYSDQIMRSGTINEKMGIISSLQKGINIYDPAHYNDFIGAVIDNQLAFMGGAPGYGSTLGGLQTNIFGSAFGIDFGQRSGIKNLQSKGLTGAQLVAMTNGDLSGFSNRALANFAADQNQTAKDMQEIHMENISTYVAAIYEQIGYWGDVIGVLLKGIGSILGAKLLGGIGKKLLTGAGGKGLSSMGTYLGAGLTQGFAKGATKAPFAGKLGFMSGTGGAIAGAAGVAAGGAMAIKGGMDVYNDFQTGNVGGKTALSAAGAAGGVAGAGALIALGASNPIGWVALAVGGIALLGRAAWEAHEAYVESTDAMNMYQEQLTADMGARKVKQEEEMTSYYLLQEQINRVTDKEEAKSLMLQAGIATEEQLADAKYDNLSALQDLTAQFIKSKETLNEEENIIYEALESMEYGNKDSYADSATAFLAEVMKGAGQKKLHKMDDTDRAYSEEIVKAVAKYVNMEGVTLTDKQQKIADVINSQNSADGWSWEEIDAVINEMDWHKTEANQLINKALGNDEILAGYSTKESVKNKTGNGVYLSMDNTNAAKYLRLALEATSAEDARAYLDQFKIATQIYDINKLPSEVKSRVDKVVSTHSLGSYRIGLNRVPYDNYLANLHEGEAVLTASTASELRNLITAYRETSNQGFIVDAAIANQTTILVSKLDEVVKAVQAINGNTVTGGWSSQVRSSMKSMTNTKVFG